VHRFTLHRVREKSLGRQALRIASIRRVGIVDAERAAALKHQNDLAWQSR